MKRESIGFSESDREKIHNLDITHSEDLKLLDTSNNAFIVGAYQKRIRPFGRGGMRIKSRDLTSEQQDMVYEKKLLPKDFRAYWALIDTTGNNTPRKVTGDYYDWQYPDYHIHIYMPDLFCKNPEYPADTDEELAPCFTSYGEKGRRRDIDAIGRVFKASGGWPVLKDRLYKFYKAVEEYFFPTYVRRDLMNDPYFLIERGQYKEARAGLSKLPPNRRAFCEEKLKALGK
jgi:hypothetical protein